MSEHIKSQQEEGPGDPHRAPGRNRYPAQGPRRRESPTRDIRACVRASTSTRAPTRARDRAKQTRVGRVYQTRVCHRKLGRRHGAERSALHRARAAAACLPPDPARGLLHTAWRGRHQNSSPRQRSARRGWLSLLQQHPRAQSGHSITSSASKQRARRLAPPCEFFLITRRCLYQRYRGGEKVTDFKPAYNKYGDSESEERFVFNDENGEDLIGKLKVSGAHTQAMIVRQSKIHNYLQQRSCRVARLPARRASQVAAESPEHRAWLPVADIAQNRGAEQQQDSQGPLQNGVRLFQSC